jgi:hypothetical protein
MEPPSYEILTVVMANRRQNIKSTKRRKFGDTVELPSGITDVLTATRGSVGPEVGVPASMQLLSGKMKNENQNLLGCDQSPR